MVFKIKLGRSLLCLAIALFASDACAAVFSGDNSLQTEHVTSVPTIEALQSLVQRAEQQVEAARRTIQSQESIIRDQEPVNLETGKCDKPIDVTDLFKACEALQHANEALQLAQKWPDAKKTIDVLGRALAREVEWYLRKLLHDGGNEATKQAESVRIIEFGLLVAEAKLHGEKKRVAALYHDIVNKIN